MAILLQVDDSPYGDVLGTQLTAIAAKDNVSAIVEVSKMTCHLRMLRTD